jgi:hypothetical protein
MTDARSNTPVRPAGTGRERRVKASRLRAEVLGAIGLVALLVLAYVAKAWAGLHNDLVRAAFRYADNQFSEAPLFVQLARMGSGGRAYTPTHDVASYVYGPVYLSLMNALHGGQLPDVVALRSLGIAIGVLAAVPLALTSVVLAWRAGVRRRALLPNAVAAVAGFTLGVAVLSRANTFDTLHPDNLLFALAALSLAIFYAVAARLLPGAVALLLVPIGVLSAFTEQQTLFVAPVLLVGLAALRRLSLPMAIAAVAATFGGAGLWWAAMPKDARAWVFQVPLAQPYFASFEHVRDGLAFLMRWQPYLGLGFIAAGLQIALTRARERGRYTWLWNDLLPMLAIVVTAFAGYLRAFGFTNSLCLIAVAVVPYLAALLATLVEPLLIARRSKVVFYGSLLLAIAVAVSLGVPPKQEADEKIVTEMSAVDEAAHELCARGKTIEVMAFPDLFADCPAAKPALAVSFQQLTAAFPRYFVGPTVYDGPIDAGYVVTVSSLLPPGYWTGLYRLEKSMPAVIGFDQNYFPVKFLVYRRK